MTSLHILSILAAISLAGSASAADITVSPTGGDVLHKARITHNLVRDLPYTGITVGFRWSPTPSTQRDCLVEGNHIHDVMNLLADGGGIYTLGFQPGTVLRGNLIHDVRFGRYSHDAGNNGFFLDEHRKGFLLEANTVRDAANGPVRHNANSPEGHTWKDNDFGKEVDTPPAARDRMLKAGSSEEARQRRRRGAALRQGAGQAARELRAGLHRHRHGSGRRRVHLLHGLGRRQPPVD